MWKNKKKAAVAAALLLSASMLAACGGDATGNPPASGGAASTGTAAGENVKVTIMMPHFGGLPGDSKVEQAWEEQMREKLGVNLEFEWNSIPYSEYTEKSNVALAANDFPDMMRVMDKNQVIPYEDQEMFVELSQYKELMPNYLEWLLSTPVPRIRNC